MSKYPCNSSFLNGLFSAIKVRGYEERTVPVAAAVAAVAALRARIAATHARTLAQLRASPPVSPSSAPASDEGAPAASIRPPAKDSTGLRTQQCLFVFQACRFVDAVFFYNISSSYLQCSLATSSWWPPRQCFGRALLTLALVLVPWIEGTRAARTSQPSQPTTRRATCFDSVLATPIF